MWGGIGIGQPASDHAWQGSQSFFSGGMEASHMGQKPGMGSERKGSLPKLKGMPIASSVRMVFGP
jgi:hypothetical protein